MSTTTCRRQLRAAMCSIPMLAVLLAAIPLQPAVRAAPAGQAAPDPYSHTGDAADRSLVRNTLAHPAQDDVFYFVLPDRFDNGDQSNDTGNDAGGGTDADILRHGYEPQHKGYYHGGDLVGLSARLDYLKQLGITAIWMAPIFRNRPVQCGSTVSIDTCSAAYHGYWITDFTDVDPHFGTKAQLRRFVDGAHELGIKVFFDIVINHTADVIKYAEPSDAYISKRSEPYRDASGTPFDDRDYAGTGTFPPLDPAISFPYTPVFATEADETAKQPAWLNDPTLYHNRGNSTFAGESSEYGDFFGLDDLFTEQPRVVDGMIEIHKSWISDYGIDGYRIDTVKHVNMEFWQAFGPAIQNHAAAEGKRDFFMFGEVFDGDPRYTSRFTTEGKLPAVLDFGFMYEARSFASSGPTNKLRDFFAKDDFYTDADSNAYRLPTFLGNHDIGRIGTALRQDNPDAGDAELLARDKLAHALMYFSRGMPVVYYGDEQGFVGDGGDRDAREDMFGSAVDEYNDNDLIGTDATTAEASFNQSHPLYQALKAYAGVRRSHEALRRGVQIQRFSTDQAGIYAFSRIATQGNRQQEYVLAFNNAETEQSATFATEQPNGVFVPIWPRSKRSIATNAAGEITVTVPALSFAILRSVRDVPRNAEAPGIRLSAPAQDQPVNGRVAVTAELDAARLAEVTFAVKVDSAANWTVIGTDANAPYNMYYDTNGMPEGTSLSFKAIANDPLDDTGAGAGDLNSDTVAATVVPKRRGQVVFNVTVPANTPADKSVFIAGTLPDLDPDLPAWDPGAVALTRVDATHWTITISGEEGTILAYKYTLGSWDFVEKQAANCAEINNRQLTVAFDASATQLVNDTVENWLNVPPCGP